MRLVGKRTMAILVVLLAGGGYAAYRAGLHLWARHHYQAAESALQRRDFREAGVHLKQCLEVWSGDPALWLLAAQTARRGGNLDEARRELRAHDQLHGPESERRREFQLLALQQGDVTATDALLDRCLRAPDAPDAYLILEAVIEEKLKLLERASNSGMTLLEGPAGQERARTEKAVALWCQLRPERADQAQGRVWRGKIHLLTDQQAARADFLEALDLDPDSFAARLHLAATLVDFDAREGARHLEILRKRDPQNIQVCLLLALLRRALGQIEEAQQVLDEVLASHPDHVPALLERGKATFDAGQPQQAERFLRRAMALSPNEPGIHLVLSRCLHLTGKKEEAKYHQDRYSELESERTRIEREKAEEERAAWRKRLEQDSLQKGPPAGER